ncbi:glycosyltransferase [Acidimangrovimonas sediminis]|uniref:glycosyltransferase n=1 Tax=Acidimangrovimonas sediminis TaxID=2056283 RepID=UPI000C7FE9E3|nr:glycosyltransferase [Acidimangrovimonas sediminis]
MTCTSIVIATDGRAAALAQTLKSLQYLEGPEFEVIVVTGPTQDGTAEIVAGWGDAIKVFSTPNRNLSESRNIGIRAASGDFVAFIDDDGNPEPEWLRQLIAPFEDPLVSGTGGLVMDHTGWWPQYRYASANRLGNADWQRQTPADHFNFPYSYEFPYLQGTNSAFRKSMLLEVGAFDEEYEFYLDETDVCCRMVDRGWTIRQLPDAIVHHKFLPSKIRDANRITRARYAVLKNKLYFSLINNHGHYSVDHAVRDMLRFAEDSRRDLEFHCEAGRLPWSDLEAFDADLSRAWEVGMRRGLSGQRRTLEPASMRPPPAFVSFPRLTPANGREHYVLVTGEFPPERVGGIGRNMQELSRGLAARGNHVRIIASTEAHPRIDFEDGVWVERLPSTKARSLPEDLSSMPEQLYARAATVADRIEEIDQTRPVSAVYAPIWDSEGIGVLRRRKFPLLLALQTTLRFWLDSHPHWLDDEQYMTSHGTPMLKVEKELLFKSDALHANSAQLVKGLVDSYGIDEGDSRVRLIPHGLADWTLLPRTSPKPLKDGMIRVLFVGRLERRKGIDILLEVAPKLLEKYPHLHFDIVGNNKIASEDGKTYQELFVARNHPRDIAERIQFHGEVDEAQLRGFYEACDIMVGPSRYESFGLMLLEGMMFGKPVIGCAAGGMLDVVEDGVSGILAQPADADSLEAALDSLIRDPAMRSHMGAVARARFETHFSADKIAEELDMFMREVASSWQEGADLEGGT